MGRVASGYQLYWRGQARGWTVRFRHEGERYELSTGIKERRARSRAEAQGRQLYARAIRGELERRKGRSDLEDIDLSEAAEQWLASIAVRPATRELYTKYAAWWVDRWASVADLTREEIALYCRERLRLVTSKSASTELGAMRSLLLWCVDAGLAADVPTFPRIHKADGTPSGRRTRIRAPEYSPQEIRCIISALPEFAPKAGFPIRARAIVAYETSLRPTTLDQLRVPEHYESGQPHLRITAAIDKESNARDVPLTDAARRALDSVCPEVGLIFGRHRLDNYVKAAASKALTEAKADRFTMQHFRSASITHRLERTGNLVGVQYLAGHLDANTTSRYARPSYRAALDAIRGTESGDRSRRRKKA